MSEEVKSGPEADEFAADYSEGAALAQEWIAGKGDLPDLLRIVRDMPRGMEMTGREAGFLCTLEAALRGAQKGVASPPEPAQAKLLIERSPTPSANVQVDADEFHQRRREHARAAKLKELARQNAEAFEDQARAFGGGYARREADWDGR